MRSTKFYEILIGSLFVLNLATLIFLWTTMKDGRPPHHERKSLVEVLDLKGEAKEQILALETEHFKVKDSLINRSRELHERLFQFFKDSSHDSSDVSLLIDKIVENQRETEQMTFDYFKKVNNLCSPAQQEELQKLIHNVLGKMGGPPHPPKK